MRYGARNYALRGGTARTRQGEIVTGTKPHAGAADLAAVRPRTATEYLAQILDVLQADRLVDLPSDATDYRDMTLGTAADSLFVETSTQFGYVYIPNLPRDIAVFAGARGQFLGYFYAGNTVQFRIPRANGLTFVYGAALAAQPLTVVFSARPLDINIQQPAQRALDSASYGGANITPNDTNLLARITRSIYVGGAGAVAVTLAGDGTTVTTFSAVPVGTVLPVAATRVMSTGTTATLLVGLS